MKPTPLFAVVAILVSFAAQAQEVPVDRSLLERIKQDYSSVATCRSLANADVCTFSSVHSQTPVFDYTRPIAFVIPKAATPVTHPTRLMLHIQGFRGVCHRPSDGKIDTDFSALETLQNFNTVDQFTAAINDAQAQNAVLVFPVSLGQNADYRTQLVGHFKAFTEWTKKIAQPTDGAGWYISGHSGAGTIIPDMLTAASSTIPSVRAILLQDATYGVSARIESWKKIAKDGGPKMFIESVFIDGSATAGGSRSLKASLSLAKPLVLTTSNVGHCAVPTKYYQKMLTRALNSERAN